MKRKTSTERHTMYESTTQDNIAKGTGGTESNSGEHATTDRLTERAHESVDRVARTVGKGEEKIREGAGNAEAMVKEAGQQARAQTDEAVHGLNAYVRENPLMALGIAFAAGNLLGMLTRR
jgi:ElaB/YqjD/DUF883 family membrane-anchored ribosome-binding protein